MKLSLALLLAGLAAYGGSAAAEVPDYGYLEIGAGRQGGDNLSGLYSEQLAVSAPVGANFFVDARLGTRDYGSYRYSNRREHIVQDYWQVGGGAHVPISGSGDAVLRVGYLHGDTQEGGFRGGAHSAPSAGAGVRWMALPYFEIGVFYDRDTGAFDPTGLRATFGDLRAGAWENVYSAELRYRLYLHAAFGVTLEHSDFKGENRSLLTFAYFF